MLAEVQLFSVHQHLALFRAAGAHQQACGGGILGLAGVQTPDVPLAVGDGNDTGVRAGVSNRRRLFQRAQPAGTLGLLRHARFPGGLG